MMNKLLLSLGLIFVFVFLGYVREFLFVHINVLIYEKYYNHTTEAPFPAIMNVFRGFDYETLYYSKYFFTLFFVALFLAANYYSVNYFTKKAQLSKLVVYIFAILLFSSIASMLYGYFINGHVVDDEYTLSRWLMGIAQSPIICLILIASEKLYLKSTSS